MKSVVDASVAAKWLAPEPESPFAAASLDDELAAPDLIFAEVGNILWKKQLRGEMDGATARLAARWLVQVPMAVHGAAGLLDDALALALHLQHPAYDCFYLALARRIGAPLLTADRRLHARCLAAAPADLGAEVKVLGA